MTTTFELMLDCQLAEKAGVDHPQFIEWEYEHTLAGLMKMFLPPYQVVRMVDEAEILIPPPPESIVIFLEATAQTKGVSVEAQTWLRRARAAVEAAKVEDVEREPEVEQWLQRVKAARPALKAAQAK